MPRRPGPDRRRHPRRPRDDRLPELQGHRPVGQQRGRDRRPRLAHQSEGAGAGAKVVAIDPRYTPTSAGADVWLPIRPGTDTALVDGMINYIIQQRAVRRDVPQEVHGRAVPRRPEDEEVPARQGRGLAATTTWWSTPTAALKPAGKAKKPELLGTHEAGGAPGPDGAAGADRRDGRVHARARGRDHRPSTERRAHARQAVG